jgi:hypothetical protein
MANDLILKNCSKNSTTVGLPSIHRIAILGSLLTHAVIFSVFTLLIPGHRQWEIQNFPSLFFPDPLIAPEPRS